MKRAQCFAGAKNHSVIMPDANKEFVLNNLVGEGVGAAGQRCMAISVAVFVGDSAEWIPELAKRIGEVKPGLWDDKDAGFGPLISPQAKAKVLKLIAEGKAYYAFDTSRIAYVKYFAYGKQSGRYMEYYPNGKPMLLAIYQYGELHGDWDL